MACGDDAPLRQKLILYIDLIDDVRYVQGNQGIFPDKYILQAASVK